MYPFDPDLLPFHGLTAAHFDRGALTTRILERLTVMLVMADEILGELTTEEANRLLWLEPKIRSIYAETDATIGRLAQ